MELQFMRDFAIDLDHIFKKFISKSDEMRRKDKDDFIEELG